MSVRNPARNAELALLLEVAGTPKPGNVDRERDLDDLHFEHFLAGAVGTQTGLRLAAGGAPVGEAFETGVAGMSEQSGGNTQFGCLLLLVPLVRATTQRELSPEGVTAVVEGTDVADAADFYRAFEHVDVYVDDPPEDMGALDVRRGSDAVAELERRGLTLYDVMERSAPEDGVAAEWVNGFERTFETAERIETGEGPVTDRAADAFLALLAAEPDTLVAKRHGRDTAREVQERAAELRAESRDTDREEVREFGDELVERGVNPGTTADLVAAGLYVALERGVEL